MKWHFEDVKCSQLIALSKTVKSVRTVKVCFQSRLELWIRFLDFSTICEQKSVKRQFSEFTTKNLLIVFHCCQAKALRFLRATEFWHFSALWESENYDLFLTVVIEYLIKITVNQKFIQFEVSIYLRPSYAWYQAK